MYSYCLKVFMKHCRYYCHVFVRISLNPTHPSVRLGRRFWDAYFRNVACKFLGRAFAPETNSINRNNCAPRQLGLYVIIIHDSM